MSQIAYIRSIPSRHGLDIESKQHVYLSSVQFVESQEIIIQEP